MQQLFRNGGVCRTSTGISSSTDNV